MFGRSGEVWTIQGESICFMIVKQVLLVDVAVSAITGVELGMNALICTTFLYHSLNDESIPLYKEITSSILILLWVCKHH